MIKPRKWWIEFSGDPSRDDKENYKRYVSGSPFDSLSFSDEVVSVIEKTGYDALLDLSKEFLKHHDERKITNGWHDLLAKKTKTVLQQLGEL